MTQMQFTLSHTDTQRHTTTRDLCRPRNVIMQLLYFSNTGAETRGIRDFLFTKSNTKCLDMAAVQSVFF